LSESEHVAEDEIKLLQPITATKVNLNLLFRT